MHATVLIVEDEEHLRDAIAEYLGDRGFTVLAAGDAKAARGFAEGEDIQLAVLDIAMPGEDGLSLARWLRGRSPELGIIFATSSGMPIDRIVGLEIGADDYMVKPYDLRELLARIRSVMRRIGEASDRVVPAPAAPATGRSIPVGRFVLNPTARQLVDETGGPVSLTSTEFELLAMLAARPNRALSRNQLLAGESGLGQDDSPRSVDIRVTRLRSKIEVDPQHPRLIQTVRGEGYMFVPAS
jgi:two-component system phosphate regulon response regulator OmpR